VAVALAVGGLAPAALAAPANDDFASALAIDALPFTHTVDTADATRERGERASDCEYEPRHTVWYSYTPQGDSGVTVDTQGSDFDTVLTVFTGTSLRDLSIVACNDDAGGLQSRVGFPVTGGLAYLIKVSGYDRSSGTLVLNVSPPAANDAFTAAIDLANPATAEANTAGATLEDGEPQPSCAPSGATLWYRFTADDLGIVRITTAGSDFDTVLAVYEGDDLGDLTEVACSDDTGVPFVTRSGSSEVTFLSEAGRTYMIQAGGFGGDIGALALAVSGLLR
jgi:hypothetical protein